MIDAVLGLIIATIATSALTLAVEFTEASFARKDSLDAGMSTYELEVLDSAELNDSQKTKFKNFLANTSL
ncbi:hypothetical protein [Prochlorococcus sp. MIT 1303]|uniref:hypothetical protein n=1 Tax=Prochlorococcus sp. MIT 1303 TaxID=1723647 RepID=UPI0007B33B6D|nr:hypothetical protein [Prochlorococcus sp. MIT 1303]KZR62082.1 hypothetical protein PMIT1303_02285 [Prochlorococcus sp. MIT 1303]